MANKKEVEVEVLNELIDLNKLPNHHPLKTKRLHSELSTIFINANEVGSISKTVISNVIVSMAEYITGNRPILLLSDKNNKELLDIYGERDENGVIDSNQSIINGVTEIDVLKKDGSMLDIFYEKVYFGVDKLIDVGAGQGVVFAKDFIQYINDFEGISRIVWLSPMVNDKTLRFDKTLATLLQNVSPDIEVIILKPLVVGLMEDEAAFKKAYQEHKQELSYPDHFKIVEFEISTVFSSDLTKQMFKQYKPLDLIQGNINGSGFRFIQSKKYFQEVAKGILNGILENKVLDIVKQYPNPKAPSNTEKLWGDEL